MTKYHSNRTDCYFWLGASAEAETGSRASTESCSTVSALTGFDPARIPTPSLVATALHSIGRRADAMQLYMRLLSLGFAAQSAQLGMQRAWDGDKPTIRVLDNFDLEVL